MTSKKKIICPICRRPTPETLEKCVHCKAPIPKNNWNISGKNMMIIGIILLLLVIYMFNRSCSSSEEETGTPQQQEQTRESTDGI